MTNIPMCEDKGSLVAYLYGEVGADERVVVERHLETCAACREELDALRALRGCLAEWTPPEEVLGFRVVSGASAPAPRPWWRAPAWGLAAAAVLLLAVSAAIAHVEIRYDRDGFVVRTGWGAAEAAVPAQAVAPVTPVAVTGAAPWAPDLAQLEARLRTELAARPPAAAAASTPSPDAALLRQVRGLIEASEARQQRELALRVTDLLRDVGEQRRADWARIQAGFGRLEELTGAGVAQQREMLNYVMRTSQRTPR
jgi:hypothetical protein